METTRETVTTDLVTTQELATILKLHPVHIRRLGAAGRLPRYKIGGGQCAVRYSVREVLAALRERGDAHE